MPLPPRTNDGLPSFLVVAYLILFGPMAQSTLAAPAHVADASPISERDAVLEIFNDAATRPIARETANKPKKRNPDNPIRRPVPASAKKRKRGGKAKKPVHRVSVEEMCIKIGAKLGSVSKNNCMSQKLTLSDGQSVKGLPILVREFPPVPPRKPQARILLLGGIHGDEYSSVSIVFKWLKILERHHSGLFHWIVSPLVNPDGLLRRKSIRMNANGVDLNRNFPTTDWRRESRDYWVRRTRRDKRRYPGPSPLSEPESAWVAREIERFQPHAVVTVHAPYGLLDFDGPPTTPPEKLGNIFLSPLGTYPGSMGRYIGVDKKIPILTIELPYAGIMPSPGETASIWADLVRWLAGHLHNRNEGSRFNRPGPPLPGSPPEEKPSSKPALPAGAAPGMPPL